MSIIRIKFKYFTVEVRIVQKQVIQITAETSFLKIQRNIKN